MANEDNIQKIDLVVEPGTTLNTLSRQVLDLIAMYGGSVPLHFHHKPVTLHYGRYDLISNEEVELVPETKARKPKPVEPAPVENPGDADPVRSTSAGVEGPLVPPPMPTPEKDRTRPVAPAPAPQVKPTVNNPVETPESVKVPGES